MEEHERHRHEVRGCGQRATKYIGAEAGVAHAAIAGQRDREPFEP